MTPRPLLTAALTLLLAAPALAKDLPCEVVARGDDGPATATQETLGSAQAIARWRPGLTPTPGRTLVAIALGEQPKGARFVGARAREADRWGLEVRVAVRAILPLEAKTSVRPYVILSFPGRPMRVEHSLRVALTMGETRLSPMSLEAAQKTRARLTRMSKRQRREVAALHARNVALRQRLAQAEEQVLAYSQDPAYRAAEATRPFKESLRRAADLAALQTDRHFFGSTANPMISTGDQSLKYLSLRSTRGWPAEVAKAYAGEAAELKQKIAEMQKLLGELQAVTAKYAPASKTGGLVEGLQRD